MYPGEILNIHVFEPKYKQLIRDCIDEKKKFGMPVILDKKIEEFGTVMEITEMVQEYDNGEMDVRTKGIDVFRVLEVVQEIPEKLYCGAIVNYPENIVARGDTEIGKLILKEVKRLYSVMSVESKFPNNEEAAISYQIAHFTGLSRQQEYEVLGLFTELHRLEYLRRHLKKMEPMLEEMEKMKARVQLNGHFRNLSASDLNL